MSCWIPNGLAVVEALAPAADAAGRTGDYVSLKNAACVYVVAHITQGHADTVKLTIEQATAVAGTGSKAITKVVQIWSNLDTATSDTMTSRTAAVEYTTDAALKNKIVIFKVNAADLDATYNCITVKTGASNAANITQATYLVCGPRYTDVPSVIVD